MEISLLIQDLLRVYSLAPLARASPQVSFRYNILMVILTKVIWLIGDVMAEESTYQRTLDWRELLREEQLKRL